MPPRKWPLGTIGQFWYLIFPAYAVVLALALGWATIHGWTADLSKQKGSPKMESLLRGD